MSQSSDTLLVEPVSQPISDSPFPGQNELKHRSVPGSKAQPKESEPAAPAPNKSKSSTTTPFSFLVQHQTRTSTLFFSFFSNCANPTNSRQ